jgi:hypothetical protein
MLSDRMGGALQEAGAPFPFAPPKGRISSRGSDGNRGSAIDPENRRKARAPAARAQDHRRGSEGCRASYPASNSVR